MEKSAHKPRAQSIRIDAINNMLTQNILKQMVEAHSYHNQSNMDSFSFTSSGSKSSIDL